MGQFGGNHGGKTGKSLFQVKKTKPSGDRCRGPRNETIVKGKGRGETRNT